MANFCRYADGKKLDRNNEIVPLLAIGWYKVGERHPFFHSVDASTEYVYFGFHHQGAELFSAKGRKMGVLSGFKGF